MTATGGATLHTTQRASEDVPEQTEPRSQRQTDDSANAMLREPHVYAQLPS